MEELVAQIRDAPAPRPFLPGSTPAFGLIAEIKHRSPSVGPMREENVRAAPEAYERSGLVQAISILTNETWFDTPPALLRDLRGSLTKPILRKDFLVDEYQVYEARAMGADAILLMANVLDAAEMTRFFQLARGLGMEVLFEVHEAAEIDRLPDGARVVGINSRKFQTRSGFVGRSGSSTEDFSTDLTAFGLADRLPVGTIKVAESGLSADSIADVSRSFHAALVGTSLLRDPRGPSACLDEFADALEPTLSPAIR